MFLRLLLLVCVVGSLGHVPVFGQTLQAETKHNGSQTYLLQLAELHFADGHELWLPKELDGIDAEIGRLKTSGLLKGCDYIHSTILAGEQTSLTYGRMISVVTGITKSAEGTTRQTQWRDIGSSLNIVLTADGDKIRATLNFRNSRATEEPDPEVGPDILNTQYQTSLLLNPGETTMVSGNQDTCLLIRIEKR